MKLFIHFGIYKAGSSYLQYVCANSKDYLVGNQIYFPDSKEDQKMRNGLISKGNASNLSLLLATNKEQDLEGLLKEWYDAAKLNKCRAVLISAEALVHQLALPQCMSLLLAKAKKTGFREIELMGFFRDLADHALSTFKHRAKSGKIKNFEEWLENVYETPQLLQNLALQVNQFREVRWVFRKFQKDGHYLKQAFFEDWLKIEVPEFNGKTLVNESLTLSEIIWMQQIELIFPLLTDIFVDALKQIPGNQKAQNKNLEAIFFNSAVDILNTKKEGVEAINRFFEVTEQLQIGEAKKYVENSNKNIVFTEAQIAVISLKLQYAAGVRGRIKSTKRKFIGFLPLVIKTAMLKLFNK